MIAFLQRLRQRKLVQWMLAYVAAAFAVIQVVDVAARRLSWPPGVLQNLIVALAVGAGVVIVLAWYRGERRVPHVAGPELLIIALLLVVGGIVVRYVGHEIAPPAVTLAARTTAALATHAATPPPGAPRDAKSLARNPVVAPPKSIAVLPFQNLSSDRENDYFVAGIQELILTKLADIGDLKVISRTSTMKYRSHPENIREVAAELGVATILEGSVQKTGNEVLINVQLVDAKSDDHIWAQSYQRTLDDVFGVEGEVAGKIAQALDAKLSPAQATQLAAVPTTNKAAYDAYLHAEYQADRGDVNYATANWKAAITLYRQAVTSDPGFALAFARLSRVESLLAYWGGAGEDAVQLNRQARHDAERALQLQPALPAARLALGYCEYYGRHDYAAALNAFGSVLASRPNDADALVAQGYVLRHEGRFDAAIDSLTHAAVLDPRNFEPTFEVGNTNLIAGRYTNAETWLKRALTLEPDSANAKVMYSRAILYGRADIPGALAMVQGDAPDLKLWRAQLLGYQRRFDEAIALVASVPDTPDNFAPGNSKALQLAIYHWQSGNAAAARPLFAKALPEDRATLGKVQGHVLAFVWNSVAFDELGTGRRTQGLAAIARSEAILDKAPDAVTTPNNRLYDAMAYAMAKRPDLAVPLLAKALSAPGNGRNYAPVLLWLDPGWDPIRHDAGFQALLQRYAKHKPASLPPSARPAATPKTGASEG